LAEFAAIVGFMRNSSNVLIFPDLSLFH